ncbi:helix-turn-helix transcriptional regulator [Bacillus velezensis]|nr:helix-turn-helix transcriptional regulator [Bacillus velezensis]
MKSNLRKILEEDGRSQKFLASKIGISETSFSALKNGKSLPTLPVAYKLAKLLNRSIEDIWFSTTIMIKIKNLLFSRFRYAVAPRDATTMPESAFTLCVAPRDAILFSCCLGTNT